MDVASRSKADLIELHFGLGQYVCNAFGLWADNRGLLTDCQRRSARYPGESGARAVTLPAIHPDDASTIILKTLWDRLHN